MSSGKAISKTMGQTEIVWEEDINIRDCLKDMRHTKYRIKPRRFGMRSVKKLSFNSNRTMNVRQGADDSEFDLDAFRKPQINIDRDVFIGEEPGVDFQLRRLVSKRVLKNRSYKQLSFDLDRELPFGKPGIDLGDGRRSRVLFKDTSRRGFQRGRKGQFVQQVQSELYMTQPPRQVRRQQDIRQPGQVQQPAARPMQRQWIQHPDPQAQPTRQVQAPVQQSPRQAQRVVQQPQYATDYAKQKAQVQYQWAPEKKEDEMVWVATPKGEKNAWETFPQEESYGDESEEELDDDFFEIDEKEEESEQAGTVDSDFYYQKGLAAWRQGDITTARENLQWAYELDPEDPEVKRQYMAVLDTYYRKVSAMIKTGIYHYNAGQVDKAKPYFRQALSLMPTNEVAQNYLRAINQYETQQRNMQYYNRGYTR